MKNLVTHIGSQPVEQLAKNFGTPTFVYEKAVIEKRIDELKVFEVIRFAQKACSNIAILALMRKNGVVVDAVSAGEVYRALKVGYTAEGHPAGIVFTADLFDDDAMEMIRTHNIPVNVGSPDMITQLGKFHPGAEVTLRINPGFGHGHSRKVNTGGSYSKHGIWHSDLEECLRLGVEAGVNIQGLHMHIGSGSDYHHLSTVCDAMVKAAKRMGPQLKVISAGGGLPIPYRKEQARIDIAAYYCAVGQGAQDHRAGRGPPRGPGSGTGTLPGGGILLPADPDPFREEHGREPLLPGGRGFRHPDPARHVRGLS